MSLTSNTIYVILMILLAGLLGGAINCLQARKADEPSPKSWIYYVLLSIAAAFSVPLFLSLTKSALLTHALATTPSPMIEDWFVLFAVCLVAAVFAQNFLESVSSQLMKRMDVVEKETKETAEKTEAATGTADKALNIAEATGDLAANQTTDQDKMKRAEAARAELTMSSAAAADPDTQKILNTFKNPKFPLGRRSIGGIVLESKLPRATATAILNKLVADGIVDRIAGELSGSEYYELRGG